MKRLLRGLTAGAIVSLCAGCVIFGDKADVFRWHFLTLPYFVFDNAPVYHQPKQTPVMEDSTNVAIAISGGGSRSAVFAAGIFEQLAHMPGIHGGRSVLESCDVISGVSGGSLAATYYALYKPKSFSDPEESEQFFRHFQSQMTCDFVSRSMVHFISHPWEAVTQYYTRHRLVQTMANTFDQYLFHGATFEDIESKEHCENSPALLLNAVSLDSGQKFLFTNLNVAKNFCVDPKALAAKLPSVAPESDVAVLGLLGQIVSSDICKPFGFDSIDSDIGMFRLASAIAASSAYPVIPGPAALIDYAHNGYVHLGDGGLNDNTGMDAIVQLYLHKLEHASSRRKLVILAINVTGPVTPRKQGDPNGWVSSIAYGERASVILAQRGQTFAQTLMQAPQSSIRIVSLNIQDSCLSEKLTSPIATLCMSEEDYGTVIAASADVAERHRKEIADAIRGR